MPERTIEDVEEIVLAADAAGQPVPDGIEAELCAFYRDHYGMKTEVNAAMHRLPPERFARFTALVAEAIAAREANLVDSTDAGFAEYVPHLELDKRWHECVVRNAIYALDKKNFFSSYQTLSSSMREAIAASVFGTKMMDAALAEIAKHARFATSEVGAQLRLLFRRCAFMALRGTPRTLELVLPDDDLRYIDHVSDAIGREEPLKGLSSSEIDTLFAAWSALDWDGTLDVASAFERDFEPPQIESRSWAELRVLVEKTSLHRICRGERDRQTLSRVFARAESVTERLLLAERIAGLAKGHGEGADTMKVVLVALAPHIGSHTLEGKQLRAWVGKFAKSKSADAQELAQRYSSSLS